MEDNQKEHLFLTQFFTGTLILIDLGSMFSLWNYIGFILTLFQAAFSFNQTSFIVIHLPVFKRCHIVLKHWLHQNQFILKSDTINGLKSLIFGLICLVEWWYFDGMVSPILVNDSRFWWEFQLWGIPIYSIHSFKKFWLHCWFFLGTILGTIM